MTPRSKQCSVVPLEKNTENGHTGACSALPEDNDVTTKSQWKYQGLGITKARFVMWGSYSDIDGQIGELQRQIRKIQ